MGEVIGIKPDEILRKESNQEIYVRGDFNKVFQGKKIYGKYITTECVRIEVETEKGTRDRVDGQYGRGSIDHSTSFTLTRKQKSIVNHC